MGCAGRGRGGHAGLETAGGAAVQEQGWRRGVESEVQHVGECGSGDGVLVARGVCGAETCVRWNEGVRIWNSGFPPG